MYRFPLGKAARAISAVRAGTFKGDAGGKLIGVPQRSFWDRLYGIALRNDVTRFRQQHHFINASSRGEGQFAGSLQVKLRQEVSGVHMLLPSFCVGVVVQSCA
jgi:hypothetical protein